MLLAAFVIGVILVWELSPPNSGAVIAVLGPNATLRQTVTETEAYFIRESQLPNSYVLFSRAPDFPARLRRAGAALVIKSDYSGTCVQPPKSAQSRVPARFSLIDETPRNDEVF